MLYPSITPDGHLQAIKAHLRQTTRYAEQTVQEIRAAAEESVSRLPALSGLQVQPVIHGSFRGEWVSCADGPGLPLGPGGQVLLYYHGGGFISGSCAICRDLAARLSAAGGIAVLTAEYRLAPEFCYPAAGDDCLAAYRWLLEQGVSPADIILGGDSVGATLALMTLITLREQGVKLPAGACLLSPHADLVHLDGESYESRAAVDPTGSREANQRILVDYLGPYAGEMPALLSPLRLDLQGLPPLLIQAGSLEVLLSDAERLAAKAQAAGNAVTLEVWENMWCSFQLLGALLPEAQQAIDQIGSFIKRTLGAAN
ncbi:alpha/beta hydrolase [Paenibacillus sp. MMS20-IR301]|uniref:alpha/beta hydrolase n=1 Tax=Paenibacillus sp. MMS20-IR301 TaxID=2895946 RepID=UPI0028E40481|nr:alpha/beta hydrolase [Paenibacillus sp. MMS20-IR301]WNS45450.1 alpha/beta hydrolase [Paenibacillus sp. MMS20-IR301]